MISIDAETGRQVEGVAEALARASNALTTTLGSREKNRKVGSDVPNSLSDTASPMGRMQLINRIFRTFENPANQLSDMSVNTAEVLIHGAGYKISLAIEVHGESVELTL